MKNVFNNNDNFATIAGAIDSNQIEVTNALFRLAYPTSTLRGLAVGDAPTAPATMDAYLVTETGTVWGVAVEKDQFIRYNGTGWDVLPLKLPDLASGLTPSTTADGVSFDKTGTTFTSETVQAVLVETDTRITTTEGEIDTLQTTVAGIETLLAAI